jgi:hypothetical protein
VKRSPGRGLWSKPMLNHHGLNLNLLYPYWCVCVRAAVNASLDRCVYTLPEEEPMALEPDLRRMLAEIPAGRRLLAGGQSMH